MRALGTGLALLIGAGLTARPAAADAVEKGAFGAGIIIGEPTGLSAKLYLRDDQALQAALALSAVVGGFQVHLDYLFHPRILEERDAFTLPFYLGPGVSLLQHGAGRDGDDDFRIGLEQGKWVAAVRQHGDHCFMIAFRGIEADMRAFLQTLPKK